VIRVKKGPFCLVYYAIKNKKQLKLEEEKTLEETERFSPTEIILTN
jgi:hypothetical protein